jgi:dsDNA-specific endonuclease/ATPase MutS2
MAPAKIELSDGVPAHLEGGTPLPLPTSQSADALETIEFAAVLERISAHTVGPMGASRVTSRRPTDDLHWIRAELDRVAEVAGLFRRGDGLLAEPIPDVDRTLARLRIEGSVLEGVELAAMLRVLVAADAVDADLRRVAESAPLTSTLARPLPEKPVVRRM